MCDYSMKYGWRDELYLTFSCDTRDNTTKNVYWKKRCMELCIENWIYSFSCICSFLVLPKIYSSFSSAQLTLRGRREQKKRIDKFLLVLTLFFIYYLNFFIRLLFQFVFVSLAGGFYSLGRLLRWLLQFSPVKAHIFGAAFDVVAGFTEVQKSRIYIHSSHSPSGSLTHTYPHRAISKLDTSVQM